MMKIFETIIKERHHLVLEEQDVTKTLEIINRHHKIIPDMAVGNCGWADDNNKWFIHFTTSKAKWEIIRNELKVVRVFENIDIPKNKIGVIYSTD